MNSQPNSRASSTESVNNENQADETEDNFEIYNNSWFSDNRRSMIAISNQQSSESNFESAQSLFEHLDPIEDEIIGAIDIHSLRQGAPTFAKDILLYATDSGPEIQRRPDEDIIKRLNRGIPRKTISPMMQQLFKIMNRNPIGNLFETDYGRGNLWLKAAHDRDNASRKQNLPILDAITNKYINRPQADNYFHANAFCVNKTKKHPDTGKFYQRIIVDARMANSHLENPAHMELFTLDALHRVVGQNFTSNHESFASDTIHVISADLRHHYHQIYCGMKYRKHYGINLGDGHVVFPKTWVMGSSPAAAVGQAVTWSLLLHNLENNHQQRKSLGIMGDKPFKEYLPWLPLEGGGGVFVLIDNIFIITRNQKYFENWKRRLDKFYRFNATLKKTEDNKNYDEFVFDRNDENASFDFSGVRFSKRGSQSRDPIDEVEFLEKQNNKNHDTTDDTTSTSSWNITFRSLATIVGQALWVYRARNKMMFELTHFHSVCRKIYPNKHQTWDDTTTIAGADLEQLLAMYNECRNSNTWSPFTQGRQCVNAAFVATDASYSVDKKNSNQHAGGIGWVFSLPYLESPLSEPLTNNNVEPNVASPTPNNNDNNINNFWVRSAEAAPNSQIALEELRAVCLAIADITQFCSANNLPDPDAFLVAIDSMHAKGMITNGMAKTEQGRNLLSQLHKNLNGRRLYLRYIASDENPADAPSRPPAPFEPAKWHAVVETFSSIQISVLDSFLIKGKATIGEKIRTR